MITIKKRFSTWLFHSLARTVLFGLIFMLVFIAVAPPGAQAAIPRYINYQGKLTDANDDPVTGDVSITIRIYDAVTGGTALWTETQTATVTRGIFSILLGNTTALTSLDFNSAYWYSVEVASDGEMTPRQRLTAVAYAINADKLGGYSASQFLRADADTSLTGALTVSGNITGSANGDITLDPTGTGNIVMKIDSTSGDFKVTDGTTNYVLVDNATGNVTMSNDLTVSGTIYGTLASTGGNSTFSSIVVTGTSDLRGNISNSGSGGAVTIADALTQTGSTNQVTFGGNVDANNGLDVTGALTVSGATTLSSALDMNSNIDLDYSGTSAALDVAQASTGPAAQFSGQRVIVGASEASNANALSTGELYVLGDLEVDGTLYANVSSSGATSLGSTTLSSLTVTGTSDLQGNVSDSGGTFTIADDVSITKTDSSTSGTATLASIQPTFQDSGTNSTTTAIGLNVAPTVNYTGTTKSGSYTALKITATETSLPTGTNYLIDAYAGSAGTTQVFYVDNSGNAKIFGTLNMNSQKITSLATPTATTDAATKAYVDSITPASAGGWTDGGTGVSLTEATDNVGIGTSSTGTYKLNVSGSTNTTTFYIGGTQVTSDASELNKVDGYTGTAANLNTLTGASNADALHTHTATGISSGVVLTAPSSAQTVQPTADVVPLTIKGKASAASNVLSIYDAAAVPSEKIYVDSAGHMRIAETTTGAAQNSAATMYFGRNATDNWEVMGYDPTLGTKGKFTFSAPLQVEASSPTGITFIEKDSEGVISKSQDFTYDPTADQFSFSGGVFAQQFKNLVKNSSFEAFSALQTFHDLDSRYATGNFDPTMGGMRNTTSGYEGGWNNFEPDEWDWVGGDVFQNAPMSYKSGYNVAATSYTQDYTQGVSAVRIKDVMLGSGPDNIGTGKDGELKQTISGLEPGKVYSVGIDMRVDPNTATATKGIVDIVNELNVTGLTLNGNMEPSTTTINITQEIAGSVARLPSNGFLWIEPDTADAEQISYTGKSADSVSGVTRGINGTTARNHNSGVPISCAFRPLEATTVNASAFSTFKGQFITDEMATSVEIHLIARSADPAQGAGTILFDSAQIVAGKSVPEYQTGTITDSGDQTIYGALRIGRASDEKGGILSVDKFVRTRGVEFFTDDPGFTGQKGGFAGFGGINPPVGPYNISGTVGSLSLFTSGNYAGSTQFMNFYAQITDATSTPNKFKWYYDDGTGAGYVVGNNDTAINVSTTDVTLGTTGVKVRFSAATGGGSGDRWDFFATRMDPIGGYNSYGTTTTYTPSGTRIFKDPDPWSPTYNQLIFEDGTNRVSITSLISLAGTPSQIDPAWQEWNQGTANSGGLSVNTSGNYTGDQEKFYKVQIVTTGTVGSSSGTFKWSDNGGSTWNPASAPYISMSFAEQSIGTEGVRVKFLENPMANDPTNRLSDAYITGGAIGDTWGFGVHPRAGAGITAHTHSSSTDGGILNAGSNKAASFTIDSENTVLNRSINFGNGVGSASILWDSNLDKFSINNDVDISGTLTATNLSGATSMSGTTNATFGVDSDLAIESTEPSQGAGFSIEGGSGDVNLTYDAANNLLNITGQSGPTDTFVGINIPAGTTYKIGGVNLSASDVGAAVSGHGHAGTDITSGTVSADRLPTAGANTAGIIPSTGLTNAMVSTNVNDAISWSKINKTGAVASDVGAIAVESDPLALKTLDTDNIKDTHIDWGTGVGQVSTDDMTEGATNLYYTDARVDSRLDTDQTIGSNWTFSNQVTIPQTPTNASDAASKVYVDNAIAGLKWKQSVRAATTTNGTLASSFANTQVIDGVTLATGDRILIKNQTTGSENGIYTVNASGAPTRATDADTASEFKQAAVFIEEGTIQADTAWVCNNDTITLGTTALTFTQFTGAAAYTWGNGLSATGTTIDVGAGDGISVDANNVIAALGTAIDTTEITDGTIANLDISDSAGIATSKLSGAVTSINNHGLGNLATLSAVSGGAVGTITDDSIINDDIKSDAGILTSKLSGAVTSITNHGLGALATLSAVGGGVGGTITDDSIINDDIKSDAGILTSKLSGAVTSITGHGLGDLATLNSVASATITDGSITSSDISSTAGILDSQLATSPTTRFYENFAEYVESGLQPATSVNLTSDISTGTAYGRGARVNKTSTTSKTYTASKDTYVDIDSSGNFQYTEVVNDAAAPAVAANSVRLAKVVTDGDNITAVTDLRNLYPVTANEIAPGAVTSTGIQDGSIGTAKLADSAVTSVKIADGTIVNADIAAGATIDQSKLNLSITDNEVALGAGIAWSKISKSGSAPSDVGAAASSHTHSATDLSGVIFTAPVAAQTIQPTADVVPLTIKGQASANSNVLSIYDAAAVPSEKIYVDKLGHMYIAETTTGAAQASSATMYFGRNATDNWEIMGYDPALGTKGMFTFSAPLQVEASSPTGITFVEKNTQGQITKSQGFMYDPAADEFSFTGGKMKQAFQNLVRGGSFESWSTPGWYSAWYSGAYTTMSYAKFGTKSLYIYDSSNTQTAYKAYYISNWDRLKGSNVTLSVWAKCDSGTTTASVGIGTNISSTDATVVNNIALTTTWQNFSFTYAVPTGATTLKVYLYGSEGTNGVPDSSKMSTSGAYYDGVTLAEGKLALEYGPSPVFDTGDQVIGGSLAIGADIDPYNTGYGMNYYRYPRIVFGEPDVNFGGYYDAYSYGGYNYSTYNGGTGEISFRPLNTSSGTFTFNRPIGMDSYEMSNASWRTPALFIGRLYNYSGGSVVDVPDYAWTTSDAYIKGVVEADGGIYGDIMSFYGGVGKTSNLLTYSEDFTQGSAWSKSPAGLQVTTGESAPDGTSTACRLTSTVDASVTQTISAANSTTYTFSVYMAPGTQSYAYIFLKSNVETEWWTWPNYQYVDLYNTTGWRRFSVTYTTPSSGTTSVMARIMFYGSASNNSIKAWGAQLRPGSSQGIYLRTTSSSITNSNSLFHGDGSGLTNLPASSIASGTAAITGISGNIWTINEDLTGGPTDNLTLAFNRGAQTDATIVWDEANYKFVINNPVNISSGGLSVQGTITAGTGSNIITTAAGLLDAAKLSGTMPAGSLPTDGYGSTYVNVSGDTMTGDLTINQNSATANDAYLAVQHNASNVFSVDKEGDVYVGGDLQVQGDQVILNVQTIEIESNHLLLNRNVTGSPVLNGMVSVERGDSPNTALRWNETSDVWDLTNDGTNYYTVLHSNTGFGGDVSGIASNLQVTNDSHLHTAATLPANTSFLGSTIGTAEIEDSSITSAKIVDATIAADDIGLGAVAKAKILELRPYATTPTADNKVNIAAGIISVANNAKINFAGAISPVFDPVTADSRIDLLTIDSTGTLVIIPGTQAVTPVPPTYPTDKLAIAEVTITETAVQGVSITNNDILDVRPFLNLSSGSGNSSITTTDSVIFTIGANTDETASNVTLAFGNAAGGQKTIIYQGASSDDFVFNDDISLGANTLKFAANTLTDTKVGNYDSHLINTSNPHSVTAAQVGGTGIVSEINAAGTSGTINTNRIASEVLTQSEGDTRYLTPVKAVLTAEYPNAIIYGDGSNNSGTMAVKNTADLNWRNYYEWSSQNTVLQDYMITVRYELPQDFSGWALSNAIKLGYITQTALNTDNKADVTIYRAGSASAITTTTANVSTSWTEVVIDDSLLGAWSAGDILIMEIKAYSKNGNFTRVGDIILNYTR